MVSSKDQAGCGSTHWNLSACMRHSGLRALFPETAQARWTSERMPTRTGTGIRHVAPRGDRLLFACILFHSITPCRHQYPARSFNRNPPLNRLHRRARLLQEPPERNRRCSRKISLVRPLRPACVPEKPRRHSGSVRNCPGNAKAWNPRFMPSLQCYPHPEC